MLQRMISTLAVIVLLASALAAAEKRATPDDPTIVILNAFRTHPIVALGEAQHWNLQGHAFGCHSSETHACRPWSTISWSSSETRATST